MASQQLSAETQKYLEEKRVPQLMEHLYHELLLALNDDPLAYLHDLLQATPRPRLIIAGPPAGGKGTQCELIAKKYGVVHVSTGDLLREETRKGTPLGKQAQQYMNQGALVPDELITQLVKEKLATPEAKARGWLLDGFPRTKSQALSLQMAGILPQLFVVLDVPDSIVVGRISGRRTDPKTGATYHIEHNPPPAGIEVVQRGDDTAEAIQVRLRHFHKNVGEVVEAYHSCVVNVDGNRDKSAVFDEVARAIDATLVE
jgi:adenylate kinase